MRALRARLLASSSLLREGAAIGSSGAQAAVAEDVHSALAAVASPRRRRQEGVTLLSGSFVAEVEVCFFPIAQQLARTALRTYIAIAQTARHSAVPIRDRGCRLHVHMYMYTD